MLNTIITAGDKLELRAVNSIKDDGSVFYPSKVTDIESSDMMKITVPIVKGQIVPLSVGDRFEMISYTKRGLYQSKVEITRRFKEDNVFLLEVKVLTKLVKMQRRQYYRLDCLLDATYSLISEEEKIKNELNKILNDTEDSDQLTPKDIIKNKEVHKGIVTDISGGGLRFTSTMSLRDYTNIYINIRLPINNLMKEMCLECNIISSIPINNLSNQFENRLEFTNLLKDERENIIKYIFEEERKLIKKERS